MKRRVLTHRYDNEFDILAVEAGAIATSTTGLDLLPRVVFDLAAVIPTKKVSPLAVVGIAISGQEKPVGGEPWPGRDSHYGVRVFVEDVRSTTFSQIRQALLDVGQ